MAPKNLQNILADARRHSEQAQFQLMHAKLSYQCDEEKMQTDGWLFNFI